MRDRFPGTRVDIDVRPGQRLSELSVQESYSFELGQVFLGGDDHEDLEQRFAAIDALLRFEIDTDVAS